MSEGTTQRRRVPRQSRSRRTVERIHRATVDVLIQDGLDGLNTNAVAERAGVNIATLYSYFPDKYAIIYDLFEGFETQRSDMVHREVEGLRSTENWRGWVRDIIDQMAGFRVDWPVGVVLRRALSLRPELQALDERSTEVTALALADALAERTPQLDDDQRRRVARIAVTTITQQLDIAFTPTPPDLAIVEELKKMTIGYLTPYLEDDAQFG